MGATAAVKLRQVAANLETILGLEALCAAQGIDFRKKKIGAEKTLGAGTQKLYDLVRQSIPFIEVDAYMKVHIDAAVSIVRKFSTAS